MMKTDKWCIRDMITKNEIIRLVIEIGIFTILLSWMPILYQIVLSLIMSVVFEIIIRRRQKNTLNKVLESIQAAKKEL